VDTRPKALGFAKKLDARRSARGGSCRSNQ
jgi:hypothetical protein